MKKHSSIQGATIWSTSVTNLQNKARGNLKKGDNMTHLWFDHFLNFCRKATLQRLPYA